MNPANAIWILLGTLSLLIGVTGIFIPGLPTTPFLLLTAGLYLKGSPRLYNALLSTRVIGDYIREYKAAKGMTLRQKVSSIGVMWAMILISVIFFIQSMNVMIIVLICGAIGTVVMGFIVPTADRKRHNHEN
ncbi:MAG: YbaN family protein [Bacteroidales bacterium]